MLDRALALDELPHLLSVVATPRPASLPSRDRCLQRSRAGSLSACTMQDTGPGRRVRGAAAATAPRDGGTAPAAGGLLLLGSVGLLLPFLWVTSFGAFKS